MRPVLSVRRIGFHNNPIIPSARSVHNHLRGKNASEITFFYASLRKTDAKRLKSVAAKPFAADKKQGLKLCSSLRPSYRALRRRLLCGVRAAQKMSCIGSRVISSALTPKTSSLYLSISSVRTE